MSDLIPVKQDPSVAMVFPNDDVSYLVESIKNNYPDKVEWVTEVLNNALPLAFLFNGGMPNYRIEHFVLNPKEYPTDEIRAYQCIVEISTRERSIAENKYLLKKAMIEIRKNQNEAQRISDELQHTQMINEYDRTKLELDKASYDNETERLTKSIKYIFDDIFRLTREMQKFVDVYKTLEPKLRCAIEDYPNQDKLEEELFDKRAHQMRMQQGMQQAPNFGRAANNTAALNKLIGR